MVQCNANKVADPVKNSVVYGILFISLLGSLMHFLYAFSGKLPIIGIIAPVNESVWEHLKLAFLPTILWWVLSYMVLAKNKKISFDRWLFSSVIALVICPLFIVSFYYAYTGAFGIHSLILDIFSLFLGIAIAQWTALHIYRYAKIKPYHFYLSVFILAAFIIAFITFTFAPPHYPIFWDPSTGKYGPS